MQYLFLAKFTPSEDPEKPGYLISYPDFPAESQDTYVYNIESGYERAKMELSYIVKSYADELRPLPVAQFIRDIDFNQKEVLAYIPMEVSDP